MHKSFLVAVILCCCLANVSVRAETIVVGLPADPGEGNSLPFSASPAGLYQQVYTSSLFSKTILIKGLEFYNTQVNEGGPQLTPGNFTFWLSTTSVDWNTITGNYLANLGADNRQVFSGDLPDTWAFGETLVINFDHPFNYNPSQGNLLLTVDSAQNGFS